MGLSIPASIAAIAAAGFSLPVIRVTSRGIARIIPRDETYAVEEADNRNDNDANSDGYCKFPHVV